MRTQNPPPLKACRFDSDLGHHVSIWSVAVGRLLRQSQTTFKFDLNSEGIRALPILRLSPLSATLASQSTRADQAARSSSVGGLDF